MHVILRTFFREIPFSFRLLTGYSASWARPVSLKASSTAGEKNSNGFFTKPGMWCGVRVATVLKSGGLSFTIGILSTLRALGVQASKSRHSPGMSAKEIPKHLHHVSQENMHTFNLKSSLSKKKSTIWQVDKISLTYACFIQGKSCH